MVVRLSGACGGVVSGAADDEVDEVRLLAWLDEDATLLAALEVEDEPRLLACVELADDRRLDEVLALDSELTVEVLLDEPG